MTMFEGKLIEPIRYSVDDFRAWLQTGLFPVRYAKDSLGHGSDKNGESGEQDAKDAERAAAKAEWAKYMEGVHARNIANPTTKDPRHSQRGFKDGMMDRENGVKHGTKAQTTSPYLEDSDEHKEWLEGYERAHPRPASAGRGRTKDGTRIK